MIEKNSAVLEDFSLTLFLLGGGGADSAPPIKLSFAVTFPKIYLEIFWQKKKFKILTGIVIGKNLSTRW